MLAGNRESIDGTVMGTVVFPFCATMLLPPLKEPMATTLTASPSKNRETREILRKDADEGDIT